MLIHSQSPLVASRLACPPTLKGLAGGQFSMPITGETGSVLRADPQASLCLAIFFEQLWFTYCLKTAANRISHSMVYHAIVHDITKPEVSFTFLFYCLADDGSSVCYFASCIFLLAETTRPSFTKSLRAAWRRESLPKWFFSAAFVWGLLASSRKIWPRIWRRLPSNLDCFL